MWRGEAKRSSKRSGPLLKCRNRRSRRFLASISARTLFHPLCQWVLPLARTGSQSDLTCAQVKKCRTPTSEIGTPTNFVGRPTVLLGPRTKKPRAPGVPARGWSKKRRHSVLGGRRAGQSGRSAGQFGWNAGLFALRARLFRWRSGLSCWRAGLRPLRASSGPLRSCCRIGARPFVVTV